jgi:hypothetical protein
MNVTFAKQRLFDHTGWWCLIAREHKNIGKKKTTILTPKKETLTLFLMGTFPFLGGVAKTNASDYRHQDLWAANHLETSSQHSSLASMGRS